MISFVGLGKSMKRRAEGKEWEVELTQQTGMIPPVDFPSFHSGSVEDTILYYLPDEAVGELDRQFKL